MVGKSKGNYYGMYENMHSTHSTNASSAASSHKRESASASSLKRKGAVTKAISFTDTSSSGFHILKSIVDKKQAKQLVKEAEMEFKLRGKFKRVFPSIDYQYYKQFFAEERPLNALLDERIMSKRRIGSLLMQQTAFSSLPQQIP